MRELRFAAAVALAMALWCLRPMWDINVWWHLATGRWILAHGVPETDVFSAADPEAPWRTFQWGYEALIALVERAGGLRGVQLLHLAGFASVAGGVAWTLRKGGVRWDAALGVLGLALLLFEDRIRVRPHVVEMVFVTALIPLLVTEGRERVRSAALLAMGVAWANLHAVSSLWWGALVFAWVLNRPSWSRAGVLAGGVALMVAVPWAREGLAGALFSHASWPSELVAELRNTWVYAGEGWWGWAVLAGVGLGLAAALHLLRSELPLGARVAALGCAVAAVLMARWVYFAVVPLALWTWVHAWGGVRWAGLVAALVTGAHVLPRWSPSERLAVVQPEAFPEQACEALNAHGWRVPVDTPPQWTGYLLWCLAPEGRTLSDGRLIFGEEVTALLMDRAAGDVSTFDQAVGRFHTLALVWPTASRPPLDEARWRRVYADPVAEVWLPAPAWAGWAATSPDGSPAPAAD